MTRFGLCRYASSDVGNYAETLTELNNFFYVLNVLKNIFKISYTLLSLSKKNNNKNTTTLFNNIQFDTCANVVLVNSQLRFY